MIAPLSTTYSQARAAFLDAATAAGARIESHLPPRTGLEDEELYVDVAEIGSSRAAAAELVSRGVGFDSVLLNAGMVPGDTMRKSEDGFELSELDCTSNDCILFIF